MPLFTLKLNKAEIIRLYFRLSQCQMVGGRLAQIVMFMKRMLKVWPELAPGEPDAVANEIPLDARRDLTFTPEEQSAVADAFIRLLNTDKISAVDGTFGESTVGTKLEILKDADLLGSPIARHILSRLTREAVEPFVEAIEPEDSESPREIEKLA